MEEYFSDWDYYSDDYYDDDPTAERASPSGKRKTATASRKDQPAPRTRCRATRPPVKPDVTSFQGVVWKTPTLEKDQDVAVQTYEPGRGDKVALLENWREVFKSSQPALDKSRLRIRRVRDSRRSDAKHPDDVLSQSDDSRKLDTDQMSDVLALESLRERDLDTANASNTTPELGQSPDDVSKPAGPAKRGRKRKAEAPAEDAKTNGPGEESGRLRSKRVASRKGDGKAAASHASSGPVRRSARSRKS